MSQTDTRIEIDSLGGVAVPANKLWGALTHRSLEHFSIGDHLRPVTSRSLKQIAVTKRHRGRRATRSSPVR